MNKTISKWFSLLLLMIVGTVSASAQLTADNTEIDRGATKQITLTYSGTEAISGYQTDIVLPEGLSWAADPAEADEVFTASSSAQGTNGKRVVAYSAAGNSVAPQTEVLTFSVKASDDFNGGAIQLTNTKISLADDVQQNVANAVIEVSLAKYATKYAGEYEHGRVEDVYDVLAGQSVTLTAYPEEGYRVASIYGTWVNTEPEQRVEIDAETLTFDMPASSVYIYATFEAVPYNVTISEMANGTVTASSATATIGSTVTLTVTPDAGYELETLTVMNGETAVEVAADNTFVMPAAAVTVTATFKQTAVAGDETPIFITFPDYNDKGNTSYTDSWTATKDGKVWSFTGFNNYNSGWAFVKSGSKNAETTSVILSPVVNAAITDVVLTVDFVSYLNSAKLEVLNGEEVVSTQDITSIFEKGEVDVKVEGAAGYSYKITLENAKPVANGSTEISKVALYAAGEYVAPEPTLTAVSDKVWTFSDYTDGDIAETTVVDNLELVATSGKKLSVDQNSKTLGRFSFSKRLKFGGTGAIDSRNVHFKVAPNRRITVYGMSSGSEERTLNIDIPMYGKTVSTLVAGSTLDKVIYDYTGETEANVYIYSNNSGFNIYGIVVGDMVDYYDVTVAPTENGTVTADPVEAVEGAAVALTVTPAENYEVDAVSAAYNDATGAPVDVELTATETGYTFTMPAAAVTVTATFKEMQVEPTTYNVAVAETENGTVFADPTIAEEGATVTLTVTPDENYEVDAVTAAYNDESGAPVAVELTATETGYTFVMPAADVTVTATFKAKAEPVVAPAIVNPSFELADADNKLTEEKTASGAALDIYGWTMSDPGTQYNNTEIRKAESASTTSQFGTSAPSEGEYALFYRHGWNGGGVTVTLTSTTLDQLPAGNYKLSVDYKQHYSYDNTTNTNTWVGIALKSGETEIASAKSEPAAGVNGGSSDATYFNTAEWSTLTAAFTVTEDVETSNVVITLNAGGQRRSDFFIDNVQLVAVPEADIAKEALAEEIAKAEAEQAKYGVGEGLFQYPESEIKPIADAIEAAKAVLNDDAATAQAIREATQTLKDAEEAFAPKMNEPEADKAYILSVTTDAGTFQLNIEGTANTIAEQGTPIYFAKQEDGTYALTADKENYVVYEGSNAWTMSTSATPYGFTIAALADGGYTIKGKNGFYATNKGNGDAAGSAVYGDKSASNGNYIWNIALAEEETPEVTLKGDVSNDGKLSVVDVTMTVDFIVEAAEPTAYQKAAADMNDDETITVDDAAQIIQGILDFDYNAAEEVEPEPTAKARVSNADFLAIDGSRIDLNNSNEFVAFQMDVTVNGTLNAVNLTNRTANHTLRYNKISDNTYRIVVLSMSNSKLEGNNGAILDIDAIGDFEISNARFIDSNINACYINVDNTVTGISDVEAATLNAKAIYTVGGARVNTLQKGLNIVRKADGTTVKVFVK